MGEEDKEKKGRCGQYILISPFDVVGWERME